MNRVRHIFPLANAISNTKWHECGLARTHKGMFIGRFLVFDNVLRAFDHVAVETTLDIFEKQSFCISFYPHSAFISNEVRYVYISLWIFHPIRQKYIYEQNPSTASSFNILCRSFRYVCVYMCTACIAFFGSISRRTKICILKKSRAESPHHVNIASASYWENQAQ